jgi:hypothetical protein
MLKFGVLRTMDGLVCEREEKKEGRERCSYMRRGGVQPLIKV